MINNSKKNDNHLLMVSSSDVKIKVTLRRDYIFVIGKVIMDLGQQNEG